MESLLWHFPFISKSCFLSQCFLIASIVPSPSILLTNYATPSPPTSHLVPHPPILPVPPTQLVLQTHKTKQSKNTAPSQQQHNSQQLCSQHHLLLSNISSKLRPQMYPTPKSASHSTHYIPPFKDSNNKWVMIISYVQFPRFPFHNNCYCSCGLLYIKSLLISQYPCSYISFLYQISPVFCVFHYSHLRLTTKPLQLLSPIKYSSNFHFYSQLFPSAFPHLQYSIIHIQGYIPYSTLLCPHWFCCTTLCTVFNLFILILLTSITHSSSFSLNIHPTPPLPFLCHLIPHHASLTFTPHLQYILQGSLHVYLFIMVTFSYLVFHALYILTPNTCGWRADREPWLTQAEKKK